MDGIKMCDNRALGPDVVKTLEKAMGNFVEDGSPGDFCRVSFSSIISPNCKVYDDRLFGRWRMGRDVSFVS